LTAVFESSSDAREPPGLLLMLMRLLERLGRIMALIGLCIAPAGEPGGEAMVAGTQQWRCGVWGSCAEQAGPFEDRAVLLAEGARRSSCEVVGCWGAPQRWI
jgi:hypothetical protein